MMQWNHQIRLFLIILFYVGRSQLKPTKPLEQSPGEIEWEAWLLIHDNRPINGDAATTGDETIRRITPKSIFTVRPFNADNLPPCAEGYRSDAMGRCVKFIKIDQNSHLGFLVEKLNSMYEDGDDEDYDDEEDDVDKPTAGPLQFNIPFFGGNNENAPSSMPNTTDLSILLTPNIGNFTEQSPNSNDSIPLPPSDILENITLNNTREVMINLTKFADILKKPVEDLEAVFTLITHGENATETPEIATEMTDINETVTSIIEQTVNSSSSVQETTEKADQNIEKQALFFFVNESSADKTENASQTENDFEKATEIEEQTTIEDTTNTTELNETTELITEKEPEPESSEKKTEKITFPENRDPILPFPVDDEVKINRFVSSYVHFPVDVSSGDYKSSFFNSRLNENQKSTTTKPIKPVESFHYESTPSRNKPVTNNSPAKIIFEPKPTAPPPNSRPVNFYNSQEVRQRLPEFNHRNRDRNLFSWLEQNSKQNGMSSDRLATKYFVPGGNYNGAYRGYYRKTQPYNYGGKVYRQWNNR